MWVELQAKQDKGLCFRCDRKYSIGHCCPNKELQFLLVNDEEDEFDLKEGKEVESEGGEVAELSLNSVVGLTAPWTMKLYGSIGPQEVVILVDSEAAHDFICRGPRSEARNSNGQDRGYGVVMGTDLLVRGDGVC